MNFSFACSILSFLMVSASALASLRIDPAFFFAFFISCEALFLSKNLAIRNPTATPAYDAFIRVMILSMSFSIYKKKAYINKRDFE
jgi:hypothetical protein